jgi:hypothetical protein
MIKSIIGHWQAWTRGALCPQTLRPATAVEQASIVHNAELAATQNKETRR